MRLALLLLWLLFGSLGLVISGFAASSAEFHVSPVGDNAGPGTQRQPFHTLEAARDVVREARSHQGATVWLHGGRYPRSQVFSLEQQDSGVPNHPVVYRALPGAKVILDGGRSIPPAAFESVRDLEIRGRLLPEARDKVLRVDLRAQGITDYGSFGPRGFGRPTFPTPPELFMNFRITDLSAVQAKVPGFEAIPVERIGLYRDAYRRALSADAAARTPPPRHAHAE